MVCADYSNAFDTSQSRSVVSRKHSLGFSKYFLLWMIDYLTHRRQLVQIDDKKSDMATVEFGRSSGSILGPVISKRISCTKLLGVHVDQHLTWKTHEDHGSSSSYGTLSVLRRLKI